VLFDFDGTLADTAPDLAAAVNQLRAERGMERLPSEAVRPYASMGARGLLRIGFGLAPDDADYPMLRDAFLERYAARVCVDTRLFPGMAELLRELESRDIAWGIVTNKATRFTEQILKALELTRTVSSAETQPRTPSRTPRRCCAPPRCSNCQRRPAGTSATTCATSRPRALPACMPWP
jgi:phosphoglycolate phosphatase